MTLTVCLTFDFDAMSPWLSTDNPSAISRGEFGAVALPRILDLLSHRDIPATFFTPAHTAMTYPSLMKEIVAAGHEVAHHGVMHENPVELDRDAERDVLMRGIDVLADITGSRPLGWRSPAWAMSANSIELLLEHGFVYDSSLMGNDFTPYFVRRGDRWPQNEPYGFGEPTTLAELPVSWALDDFPAFEFVPHRRGGGLMPPSAVRETWAAEFDFAYARVPDAVFTLTMHPQSIGRGSRLAMLESLVDDWRARPGVRFVRAIDAAEAFLARAPT